MTGVTTNKPFSRLTGKSGTMTRREVADYLYQLKMFLAQEFTTFKEKANIEAEIKDFENIKQVSTKIVGWSGIRIKNSKQI